MKKSCNNFKIWKIIESNCKILCISIFFFFLVILMYSSSLLFYIFNNLCFLLTPLKNNPRVAIGFGTIFGGVYKGSFRIDFLGFGSYFSVCFFFFWLYFLVIFSEVLGIFLCWFFGWGSMWLQWVFFSRFQVWFTKDNLMVSMRFFVVEFLGNLLGCLGVFCELFRKKMMRVGWDGDMQRMKLGWDGVTEEKWESRERRLEKETSIEEKKRN